MAEVVIFKHYGSNFDNESLTKCRLVCKKWNSAVLKVPTIKMQSLRYHLNNLLFYDKGIYDEHHVRKQIIVRELADMWQGFHQPIIPSLEMIQDDLDSDTDSESLVLAVVPTILPSEFLTFLDVYNVFPSNRIRLYSPKYMGQIADIQFAMTREELIIDGESTVRKMVHIHPLCYSKHYKTSIGDKQFINVMCYVNILDNAEKKEYGNPDERFFVLVLEFDNLQDKETHRSLLIEQIQSITQNVQHNIEYLEDLDMQTFVRAFKLVLKQQSFNM